MTDQTLPTCDSVKQSQNKEKQILSDREGENP